MTQSGSDGAMQTLQLIAFLVSATILVINETTRAAMLVEGAELGDCLCEEIRDVQRCGHRCW